MADSVIGSVIYKIKGDTRELDSSLGKSQKSIQGFSNSLGVLKTAIGAAIGGSAIKTIIDAQEVASKFGTVFRDEIGGATESLELLTEQYGLSNKSAQDLLSSTGDLLSGFGFSQKEALKLSTQVNTLAVDLASFTNYSGGAAGASQALTKALLGERESIKSLGIAITEADITRLAEDKGIVGELDRQTKAALTLELAIKQSGNAIGDFERTQDSAANQLRQLQADVEDLVVDLGENLVPVITTVITGVRDFIEGFSNLDDGTKNLILTLGGAAIAIPKLISGFQAVQTFLTGPLGIAVALATAAAAFTVFVDASLKAQDLERLTGKGADNLREFADASGDARQAVVDFAKKYNIAVDDAFEFARAQGIITEDLREQTLELARQQDVQNGVTGNIQEQIRLYEEQQGDLIDRLTLLDNFGKKQLEVIGFAKETGRSYAETFEQVKEANEDILIFSDSELKLLEQQLLKLDAISGRNKEIVEAKKSAEEEEIARQEALKAQEEERIRRREQAAADQKAFFDELAEKLEFVDTKAAALGDSVDISGEKIGILEDAIISLLELGLSPASDEIQSLKDQIDSLGETLEESSVDMQEYADGMAERWSRVPKAIEDSTDAAVNFDTALQGIASAGIAGITQGFALLIEQAILGKATLADFGKVILSAISSELLGQAASLGVSALAETAKGYAALANPLTAALAPGFFNAAGQYGIAAAGATAGAGIVAGLSGLIDSRQVGGSLVPLSGQMLQVNEGPTQERITVEQTTAQSQRGATGGFQGTIVIDGKSFKAWFYDTATAGIKNRQIRGDLRQ